MIADSKTEPMASPTPIRWSSRARRAVLPVPPVPATSLVTLWVAALLMVAGATTHAALAPTELAPLPAAVASFGAAVLDDHLYVYGGHVGRTHQHSVDNLSHRFYRLSLVASEGSEDTSEGVAWEDLGAVPGLQGLPLVAVGEEVCRVGGLSAHNAAGEDEDLHSVAEVACYRPDSQPGSGTWRSLPPLPSPRSSHDVAVLGSRLYAVGGWQLRGAGQESRWHDTVEILDLAADEPAWVSVSQPFQRRALAAAVRDGRLYALGGIGSNGTSRRVDVFDPATESWHQAPDLPRQEGPLKGFGLAAFGVDDRLYVSGADGSVHALVGSSAPGERWLHHLGDLATPRFFHRLLPYRDMNDDGWLLFVGGASPGGHLASVEALAIEGLAVVEQVPSEPVAAAGSSESLEGAELPAPRSPAPRSPAPRSPAPRSPAPQSPASQSVESAAWPGFRGHGDGQSASPRLPLTWSASSNVAWRAALPGYGQSAPILWGDQVFVTSVAGDEKEALVLSSLDLGSGEVRWRRRFASSHPETVDEMRSHGAPTPTVDGSRVYAFFESGDVIALDHSGETLWRRDLVADYGPFEGNHGIGSSPVLTDDAVILQVTHGGPSYLVALDKASGEIRWKAERPAKSAWTTPAVVSTAAGPRLVSSAGGRVEVLDPEDGRQLWTLDGVDGNNVPSAVVAGDLLVVPSSKPGQSRALRWTTDGEPAELWRTEAVTSGFASPLVYGDCVLLANKAGVVTCLDRQTGAQRWRQRVAEGSWASPIVVGDRGYYFTRRGITTVLELGPDSARVVAENQLPTEDTVYGVAAAPGAFVLRTGSEVVRIGTPPSP